MGIWGTGIFADDDAEDVRESWRELKQQGVAPAEATANLVKQFQGLADDPIDGAAFWLALASVQASGRVLQPEVRTQALAVIESPRELARWDAAQRSSRKKALEALKKKLLEPPRPRAPRKPAAGPALRFRPGDVISYRLTDGRLVLFRAFEGLVTMFEVLDFIGDAIPEGLDLASLKGRLDLETPLRTRGFVRLYLPAQRAEMASRLALVARGLSPEPGYPFHPTYGLSGGFTARLDELVTGLFEKGAKAFFPWTPQRIGAAEKLAREAE